MGSFSQWTLKWYADNISARLFSEEDSPKGPGIPV
jgi:hypothetical protein